MSARDIKRIREASLLGQIKLTHHAVEEMDDDELEVLDIEAAIMTGTIVQKQKYHGTTI